MVIGKVNKILLVTGASSDIGIEIIKNTCQNYSKIIAHYNTRPGELEQIKEELGGKVCLLKSDFSDEGSIKDFITKVSDIGCPHHIVHLSASKYRLNNFTKLDNKDFKKDLSIQLNSIYLILQSFIKQMSKTDNSRIIFMLSTVTQNTPKYTTNYSTIKFGLLGLMKALASEYAGKININAISPPLMETKFLSEIPELVVQQNAKNSIFGRNATVKDIAPIFEFLLSEKSHFITGQNIIIEN